MPSPSSSASGSASVDPASVDPASAAAPPPGCPAHPFGPGGVRRLFGPEAENDMSGLYERLRAEFGAVAPVLLHGDLPAWLVLGYHENLEVMRNPARFSRDSRRWSAVVEGRLAPDNPLMPIVAWQPICPFVEGEEHRRLRNAVNDSLGRIDTGALRAHVIHCTGRLVGEFGHDGRAELVEQFTEHLPMLVMTTLLGMDDAYGARLVKAARDLLKASETAIASNEYIIGTLRGLLARKKRCPASDFASWLLEHPAGLTDEEVVEHLRLVLIAANETTGNLMANTLRTVLTDPRYRATLSGGQMTVPEAVERALWDEPPFTTAYGRWSTGDTEIGGQWIKAGDMLVLGLAPGNLDPAIRPRPSASLRGNRAHLAFGSGPHECPGQDIARVIAELSTDVLLRRLPDVRVVVPEQQLTWKSAPLSKHLTALPVEFTPLHELPPGLRCPRPAPRTEAPAAPAPAPFPAPSPGPAPGPAAPSAAETRRGVGGGRFPFRWSAFVRRPGGS